MRGGKHDGANRDDYFQGVMLLARRQDVDARDKPGHDE
jgi:hypothetical protein